MSRYVSRSSGTSRTVLSKAPRMLEVIGPEGEVFLEADLTISGRNFDRANITKEAKNRHYGKLQVLDPNDRPTPSYSVPTETTSQDAARCHSPGDSSQDTADEKNNDDSSQSSDEKLLETTIDDEKHHNDKFVGKNVAPLELMTEFLRAVMSRNYAVAKKLCQLILIYEPENPEAKQFSSLIEEKLLMEKAHAGEEEEEEESEDSSDDSEEDSSDDKDQSEESSDESEDI